MTALGVIEFSLNSLIPVGSMIIANAMNANGLALDRFRAEVEAHTGEIESALALGALPIPLCARTCNQRCAPASFPLSIRCARSALWIPGLMAGMLLAHNPPVYASIYQFVVLALILSAAGVSCFISTWMMSRRAFSTAEQLVMRPSGVSS